MISVEPLDTGPLGPTPFRGALPSIRFSTGALLFLVGLAGLFAHQTGIGWLSRGAQDWVETCRFSAYAFMGFGSLMMVSYSLLARRVCWILMCLIGAVSLLHHWSLWSGTPLGGLDRVFDPTGVFMKPLSALLLLLTGIRIWSATQAHRIAPLIDGVILGLATASLLGYATGFHPLYASSLFSGISYLESLGFLTIGALFLLADVEYARLNLRTRRFPVALGISAFAATVSLRISEAVLDSLGHRGLEGLMNGEISPAAMALGATNTIMSLSIGAAAMVLLAVHDSTTTAQREAKRSRRLERDLERTTDCLNGALTEIARIEPFAPVQTVGDLAPTVTPIRLDVRRLTAEVVTQNRRYLTARRTRVLAARAEGFVRADRGWLARALGLMIREAAERTADRTPLVSVRLDRAPGHCVIRVSFGAPAAPGPIAARAEGAMPDGDHGAAAHALGLADAVARWHGGRFWVTSGDAATTLHLALPEPVATEARADADP